MKYRLLIIGFLLILGGNVTLVALNSFYLAMNSCLYSRGHVFPPGAGFFVPGSSFTSICFVDQGVGQDLTFFAKFLAQGSGQSTPIPAHVQITDPNGQVLIDRNYNEKIIVISVKPEFHGNYTAIVTSLEADDSRVTVGMPTIYYAFGYIVPLTTNLYEGVTNPVGTAVEVSMIIAGFAVPVGIGVAIYGMIKVYRNKSS